MALSASERQELITKFQQKPGDTGSTEVQVALLSKDIEQISGHLKINPKDYASRRGLLAKVSQRKGLLTYLKSQSAERHKNLVQALGLRG
jgi:small subunit ribosomal protein S15